MTVEVKTKNGYVKIANNLFENIFIKSFTKRELEVILLIIRLSYGFNRKKAIIKPKSRFMLVGIYRQDINTILNGLISKNVIVDHGNSEYSLNKHFDEWNIKNNSYFNEDHFNELKGLQFKEYVTAIDTNCKQKTYKGVSKKLTSNVSEELTNNEVKNLQNVSKKLTNDVSKKLTNNEVKNLQKSENCKQKTYKGVSKKLIKNENLYVKNLQTQPENASGDDNTSPPKDIFKDMLKTSLNTCIKGNEQKNSIKNFDPYFNNPLVEKFKKEYERIFKIQRCYLNNFQINKIIEICAEAPEFVEKMPEILEKMKKIKFSQGSTSIKWLLESGNWAGILNGEYDKYMQEDTPDDIDGWDIGIPTANLED